MGKLSQYLEQLEPSSPEVDSSGMQDCVNAILAIAMRLEGIKPEAVDLAPLEAAVSALSESLSVTVNPPTVEVSAPSVTVEAPSVSVEPPSVNVESPTVNIPEQGPYTFEIRRDMNGMIESVIATPGIKKSEVKEPQVDIY